MNAVQPFYFNGSEVRTIQDEQNDLWFVVKDVCAILDLGNVTEAARRLDDDERGSVVLNTLGGPQSLATVSESGLYSLIFTSRKPEARAFRKWVTGTVLPAIRKTGRFEAARLDESQEFLPDAALRLRPAVRAQVLTCAVQAAKMENGGPESIDAHFLRFCGLVGSHARAAGGVPSLRSSEWEAVDQFVADTLIDAPNGIVRARTMFKAFSRWWRENRPTSALPSQHVFGAALARHYPKRKTGGEIRYHGVTLR